MLDEQQGIGPWKLQEDGITIKNGKTGETKSIGDTIENDVVLAATGGTQSTYAGTWSILGVENGNLKLVSTRNVVKNVKIGHEDTGIYVKDENGNPTTDLIPEIVERFDEKGTETNLELEKAIWSYQHVVETLNEHAKTATGITNARSITIEDLEAKDVLDITNDKKLELSSNYGKTYNYFYSTDYSRVVSKNKVPGNDNWSDISISQYASQIFLDKDNKIVIVDSEGDEIKLDFTFYNSYFFNEEQKTKFAYLLGEPYYYYLASPCVDCLTPVSSFYVRYVFGDAIVYKDIFNSYGSYSDYQNETDKGVRAIVYI